MNRPVTVLLHYFYRACALTLLGCVLMLDAQNVSFADLVRLVQSPAARQMALGLTAGQWFMDLALAEVLGLLSGAAKEFQERRLARRGPWPARALSAAACSAAPTP